MNRRVRNGLHLALGALLTGIILCAGSARAQDADDEQVMAPLTAPAAPDSIRIGVFGQSLPDIVGNAKGFFSAQNLNIKFLQVTGSIQQFQFLRDDKYDMVNTAPDNCVNYLLNVSNPLGQKVDNRIINGLDRGWGLGLYAQPQFKRVEDLKGKNIAVDATNSGFAFVLYSIMRNHGLEVGRDYNVTPIGGVFVRYQALLAGKTDATLLSAGFDVRAKYAGYSEFDKETTVVDPYLGTVTAAKPSWLSTHRELAVRYLRAYYLATRWAVDPANRDEAIALLMAAKKVPYSLAVLLYEGEVNAPNGDGLIQDSSLDRKALFNELALRQTFYGYDQPQNLRKIAFSQEGGLIDLSYYREAVNAVGVDPGPSDEQQ